MKISGMVQAVILMLLLASAASCEVSQVYFKKVFAPATNNSPVTKSVRFLKIDSVSANNNNDMTVVIISPDTLNKKNEQENYNTKASNDLQKNERIRTKRVRPNILN